MIRHLLILAIFIFSACSLEAQTDTISTKNGRTIRCHIIGVGQMSLEYTDISNKDCYIDLYSVSYYVKNGVRHNGLSRSGMGTNLKIDTVNVSEELNYLRFCMNKFHLQYTTGLTVTFIGAALAGASVFMSADNNFKQELGIGGAAILLIGFGWTVDAHKWIGRAGWGVSGKGNMVEIHYRFK